MKNKTRVIIMALAALLLATLFAGCSSASSPVGTVEAEDYTLHYHVLHTQEEDEYITDSMRTLLEKNFTVHGDNVYVFVVIEKVTKNGREQDMFEALEDIKGSKLQFEIAGKTYTSGITLSNNTEGLYCYLLVVPPAAKDNPNVQVTYEG